jgi:hypothetical protein
MQTIEYRIDAEPRQPASPNRQKQACQAAAAFFVVDAEWDLNLAATERKWHSRNA